MMWREFVTRGNHAPPSSPTARGNDSRSSKPPATQVLHQHIVTNPARPSVRLIMQSENKTKKARKRARDMTPGPSPIATSNENCRHQDRQSKTGITSKAAMQKHVAVRGKPRWENITMHAESPNMARTCPQAKLREQTRVQNCDRRWINALVFNLRGFSVQMAGLGVRI